MALEFEILEPKLPPDNPEVSDEEVGVALCLGEMPANPWFIRAAAQLLSSPRVDSQGLARLAKMERVEPVLLHIAAACERAGELSEPWATLRRQLHPRRTVRTEALPHWTRFAILPGLTREGYAPPQCLTRREKYRDRLLQEMGRFRCLAHSSIAIP